VGHSERRQYFGETDETVARRTVAALEHGLRVIACVGESLEERESGQMQLVLRVQVEALADAAGPHEGPVIAYEPVWALGTGNAVELADTPVFDRLWAEYPHTTIKASGEAVGLPPGQMGNSEVGHLTIGSGRVLDQDLQRINRSIADGSFKENPAIKAAFAKGGDVHLLGLVSYGGVHSHMDHLKALLELAPERTWVHAFTDGG